MTAPSTSLSRRRFLSGLGAGVVVLAACGDDEDAAPPMPPAPSVRDTDEPSEPDLPPNDTAELKAIFDPRFEPLGQRVTRIGLYDLEAGFVRADDGDHLAIYVEPIDPAGKGWDDARYLETAVPGMAAATPYAFDRWRGLNSVDVCQEPPQEQNAAEEPPIETQLLVDRAASAGIDWERADLADLLIARSRSPETVTVRARAGLQQHPLWREAEAVTSGESE